MNAAIGAPAWQRMLSGRRLDLLDPSPFDIEIGDIAHGLARLARWNGQTKGLHAFTVAQHCILVEDIVSALKPTIRVRFRLAALLHDAPEYVVGDLISPFKAIINAGYKSFEDRIQQAVHIRFRLPPVLPPRIAQAIKNADKIAAYYEATQLAGFSVTDAKACFGDPGALPVAFPKSVVQLEPMESSTAQAAFLKRFETLEAQRPKGSRLCALT